MFVLDREVLPRASGADNAPMGVWWKNRFVRLGAPEHLNMSYYLPDLRKTVTGMGVRKGFTLIMGRFNASKQYHILSSSPPPFEHSPPDFPNPPPFEQKSDSLSTPNPQSPMVTTSRLISLVLSRSLVGSTPS